MTDRKRSAHSEKRKYLRLDVVTKVNLSPDKDRKGKVGIGPISARTTNISIDGICFESDKMIDTGRKLELEIFLEPDPDPVHVQGEVVWCRPAKSEDGKKNGFEIGMRLLTIDRKDENRFVVYACDRMVDSLGDYMQM